MLPCEEIRRLSKPDPCRSALAIFANWGSVFFAWGLFAALPSFLTFLGAALLISRAQVGFLVLAHEAVHQRLFRSPQWNAWVGQHVLASAIWISWRGFKVTHLRHHRAPLASTDPDLGLTGGYPISRASFFRKLCRDLLGLTFIKFHLLVHRYAQVDTRPALFSAAILHVGLALALWELGTPWTFWLLWMLPQITLTQLFLRWRGLAEHAGYAYHPDPARCTRTILPGLGTFFLAPYGSGFHWEHHLYPSIPCFCLGEVHRLLQARGAISSTQVAVSYRSLWRELVV